MREAWRWFGPNDPVSLSEIRQTGATDIVTALHEIPIGDVWPPEAILERKKLIEETPEGLTPLRWSVVESVPVHDAIKRGDADAGKYIQTFIESMRNLAAADIRVICYNFMPVIDWTRTDLRYRTEKGAYALKFDHDVFAAFDLFILQRKGAEADYSAEEIERAGAVFSAMNADEKDKLGQTIMAGLPGRMTDQYGIDEFRNAVERYADITRDELRGNLFRFLKAVMPVAEELGMKLAIHPDDPPRDLLGIPRIICTPDDLELLFSEIPSASNGVTLCAGTFGSHPTNNVVEMADMFADRIYFAHLRGVTLDKENPLTFTEDEHLGSDLDMVGLIRNLLAEEKRRPEGYTGEVFIRPDHGHLMMDDVGKKSNPGYSAIGRLKGLAEIRGVIRALEQTGG